MLLVSLSDHRNVHGAPRRVTPAGPHARRVCGARGTAYGAVLIEVQRVIRQYGNCVLPRCGRHRGEGDAHDRNYAGLVVDPGALTLLVNIACNASPPQIPATAHELSDWPVADTVANLVRRARQTPARP